MNNIATLKKSYDAMVKATRGFLSASAAVNRTLQKNADEVTLRARKQHTLSHLGTGSMRNATPREQMLLEEIHRLRAIITSEVLAMGGTTSRVQELLAMSKAQYYREVSMANARKLVAEQHTQDVLRHLREHPEAVENSVETLELSVRAANCLEAMGIKTIAQLVQCTDEDLLRNKRMGQKALREVKEILATMGLMLGMKLHAQAEGK